MTDFVNNTTDFKLAIYDNIVRIGNGEMQTLDDNLYFRYTFNSDIDSNARIKERE